MTADNGHRCSRVQHECASAAKHGFLDADDRLVSAYESMWIDDAEDEKERESREFRRVVKALLRCWPKPLGEVANCIGKTRRELECFLSGRGPSDFPEEPLRHLLRIEPIWKFWVPGSAYALIGRSVADVRATYHVMTPDNAAYCFEVVPDAILADPSWRFVLFLNHDGRTRPSVLMIPRGSTVDRRLPEILYEFSGVRRISSTLYRAIVSACARACTDSRRNARIMWAFGYDFMLELQEITRWKGQL